MTTERSEEKSRLFAPDKMVEGSDPDCHAIFGGSAAVLAMASVFAGIGAAPGLSIFFAKPDRAASR